MRKPVLLCILDGWGHNPDSKNNAISAANTPNWDAITEKYPHSLLKTSGADVGLPEGQMGNSEVGHMNIGSGRIIKQDLPKINDAIIDNSLAEKTKLKNLVSKLKNTNGTCHLMGLLSDGGVHSHQDHIIYLAEIIANNGVKVNIHAFLDGRDTAPTSAYAYVQNLEDKISKNDNIKLATISGRYYAMDRDKRWDRVKLAYDAIVAAQGPRTSNLQAEIKNYYAQDKTDEFIIPTIAENYNGVQDGDGLIMCNFRADRAREILTAIIDPSFSQFPRAKKVKFADQLGMVEYSDELNKFLPAIFANELPENTLSDVIAVNNLKQLHIAETEKYAHVTFFFNGGVEDPKKNEDRILIPSPKVATYDLQPEMSAPEVTEKLVDAINARKYDFIVVNFANPDMVGHTGILKAAIKAVEEIDKDLRLLQEAALENGYTMLVTADHGNIEFMFDEEKNEPYTAHSLNPVPFVMITDNADKYKLSDGRLADIAPTILDIMQINIPAEMTGKSLLSDAK